MTLLQSQIFMAPALVSCDGTQHPSGYCHLLVHTFPLVSVKVVVQSERKSKVKDVLSDFDVTSLVSCLISTEHVQLSTEKKGHACNSMYNSEY